MCVCTHACLRTKYLYLKRMDTGVIKMQRDHGAAAVFRHLGNFISQRFTFSSCKLWHTHKNVVWREALCSFLQNEPGKSAAVIIALAPSPESLTSH